MYLLVVSCVWNNAKRATDPGLRSATPSCHPSSGSVLRHQSLKDHPGVFFSLFSYSLASGSKQVRVANVPFFTFLKPRVYRKCQWGFDLLRERLDSKSWRKPPPGKLYILCLRHMVIPNTLNSALVFKSFTFHLVFLYGCFLFISQRSSQNSHSHFFKEVNTNRE